jgi:hypothetical protein
MTNEQKNEKTPILVVTSDKWSRDSYVVFEDDEIIGGCIPDEWVGKAYSELLENYSQGELASNTPDDDAMPTREQIAAGMEADFFSENSDVDEFWPEHHILRTGSDYYKYDDDGMCEHIDEDDALELMADVHEKRIGA